jgi:hypothetical protein
MRSKRSAVIAEGEQTPKMSCCGKPKGYKGFNGPECFCDTDLTKSTERVHSAAPRQ